MEPDEVPRQLGDLPGGVLDSRPEPRGLNRLIRTGWRRAARTRESVARAPARRVAPEGRLAVELVPKTSWHDDVQELMDEGTWERVSTQVRGESGGRCEICGGGDFEHLECHEEWSFDDRTGVQALVRMIALCPDCHQVKHIGLASIHGQAVRARAHLAAVNGWSISQTEASVREAFRVWARRSQTTWTLDMEGLRPYLQPVEYARVARKAARPPARGGDAPG